MIKRSCRPFTLLETLIAVSLAVVILSTLVFFYRGIDFINNQMEQVQQVSFKMRYVENRLSQVFPHVVPPSKKEANDDFYFFTSNDLGLDTMTGSATTMVFTFDNGFDSDKLFANNVLGRIFLDSKKRLCLAKWPSPNRWVEGVPPPMKLEVLLEGVDSLTFSFFVAPEKKWKFDEKSDEADEKEAAKASEDKKQTKGEKPSKPTEQSTAPAGPSSNGNPTAKPAPEGSWIDQWQNEFRLLPAMVKLQIKKGDTMETFMFPLPKSTRPVVYTQ